MVSTNATKALTLLLAVPALDVESLADDQYGSISMEYSRDAQGNLVDGPVTLHALSVVSVLGGLSAAITVTLNAPVAMNYANGYMSSPIPVTVTVNADCSGHCIDRSIPLGSSTGQVATDVDFGFSVQGNRVRVEVDTSNQWPLPDIDLGLGPTRLYFEWALAGTAQ